MPERELELHRQYARNEEFRELCADYEVASRAFRYWQSVAAKGDRRISEYLEMVAEIEAEILEWLGKPATPSG